MRAVAAGALVLVLGLGACEEEETRTPAAFLGRLVIVDDDSPLADVEVTLFEPESQTAVERDRSDSEGSFAFHGIPPGSYIPVVHANGYRPIFMERARWVVERGMQVEATVRMRTTDSLPDNRFRIQGHIVDDETGESFDVAVMLHLIRLE